MSACGQLAPAFAGMDRNGFLPAQGCRRCQKALQGLASGHPAELYAGTYTGLCDACTRAPARISRRYADGAIVWDLPPHCPAWRRDRESYTTYPDCTACGGQGMRMVPRPNFGGTTPEYCPACLNRYEAHAVRRRYAQRRARVYDHARGIEREYDRREKQIIRKGGPDQDNHMRALAMWAVEAIRRHEHAQARLNSWERWYVVRHHGIMAGEAS